MSRIDAASLRRLLNREGMQVEVGEPFAVHGGRRYMCIAKLVGRPVDVPRLERERSPSEPPPDPETTQTLCVLAEEADTPDAARRLLMARLGETHDAATLPAPPRPRRGWLDRLIATFRQ